MGTDIHFHIEKWDGTKWQAIGRWVDNEFHEPGDPEAQRLIFESPILIHRNHSLFSILADVRNEKVPLAWVLRMFGIRVKQTGHVPIDKPRGLPQDLSEDLQRAAQPSLDAGDFHSHTWLKVSEIESYDWDREVEVKINGVLTKTTARDECDDFLAEVLPEILTHGEADQLRCVFWFDN